MNFNRYCKDLLPLCSGTLLLLSSCSGDGKTGDNDSDATFHADDDIAMVVRSLADAINVGEPLNSGDYAFQGVLTDGTGRPLYTDLEGMPGEWSIEVPDSTMAVVRSIKVGDLVADDLQNYIVGSLQLDPGDVYVSRRFKGRNQTIYNIPGGYLTMTTVSDTTASGYVGERISITLRR